MAESNTIYPNDQGNIESALQWAADMAVGGSGPRFIATGPAGERRAAFYVLPNGYHTFVHELERFSDHPARAKVTRDFARTDSFVAYVQRFFKPSTMIYGLESSDKFVAVIDDHEPDHANWQDHIATFQLAVTPEWEAWLRAGVMNQQKLAEFLEERMGEIVEPAAADLMRAILNFKAAATVRFESNVNPANGSVQFTYHKEVNAVDTLEQVRLPEAVKIRVIPYRGISELVLDVLLRWRLEGGKASFWFHIVGADKIKDQVFMDAAERIESALGVPVLWQP